MKTIVTGGAGRLGRYVIQELLAHGVEVAALDVEKPAEAKCEFIAANLTDVEKLRKIFAAAGAVVHLARRRFSYTESGYDAASGTWKTPDVAGDAERFNDNTAMTYNVLAITAEVGVKKVICGSSLAVYGFYYPAAAVAPEYVPIDEKHPRRPHDPYGLSKLVGEHMCDAFVRKTQIHIASLRFSGIYAPESARVLAERRKNPVIRGAGALWSYVDVRDAAAACRCALEADFSGHEAFNICAPVTIMDEPTAEFVRRFWPQAKNIDARLEGNASGYATAKAERMLGFRARHLFHDGILD
ncbi:MAG TPA: NAD(P)-dependent oxidoreductase [Candidatus Binatia bacterium]|jgi:nucleoside-diphosphate-sugar epimerase